MSATVADPYEHVSDEAKQFPGWREQVQSGRGQITRPDSEIRAGDQVYLRSGSPALTVLDVGRHTGAVWCRWMNDAGAVMEGSFPMQALQVDLDHRGP